MGGDCSEHDRGWGLAEAEGEKKSYGADPQSMMENSNELQLESGDQNRAMKKSRSPRYLCLSSGTQTDTAAWKHRLAPTSASPGQRSSFLLVLALGPPDFMTTILPIKPSL